MIGKRPFERKTTYEAFTDGDFHTIEEETTEELKAEQKEASSSNGQSEAAKEEKTEEKKGERIINCECVRKSAVCSE